VYLVAKGFKAQAGAARDQNLSSGRR
jgi:hypothetical protein